MYERKTKGCARSWTFSHKSCPIMFVGLCNPSSLLRMGRSNAIEAPSSLFPFVTRRPYCPGRPKKLCFTTQSLAVKTVGARLSVVKQSFFGLPGQYGRRVTKANVGEIWKPDNPWPAILDFCGRKLTWWSFSISSVYLSNRPQVSIVYRLINHAGC